MLAAISSSPASRLSLVVFFFNFFFLVLETR